MRAFVLFLLPVPVLAADRIPVEIIDRVPIERVLGGTVGGSIRADTNTTCIGASCTSTTTGHVRGPTAVRRVIRGAVLTLLLPDGRRVEVQCDGRYAPRGDYVNQRSCRVPRTDNVLAEFNRRGTKVKLYWPASLDGGKLESEKYDFVALVEEP